MSRIGKVIRSAAAAALTAVVAPSATAQQPAVTLPDVVNHLPDRGVSPAGFGRECSPAPCTPGCTPNCTPYPCYPGQPGGSAVPMPGTPTPIPGTPSPITESLATADTGGPSFGSGGTAGAGSLVGLAGYIENAAPVTMFRLRSDFGYGMNRPDRAEYFYAKCGCFATLPPGTPGFDPKAKGPPAFPETNVDFQELIPYMEYAITNRWSVFTDVPVRFINPTVNANASGLSDINFGTKYAFISNQRRVVSFWLRATAPSGSISQGLGQGNWRIEPGLLWLEQVNTRLQLFGEIRDSIPLDRQTDFTGNVLRYGLGGSYILAQGRWGYVAPVVETVGWTPLSGKQLDPVAGVVSSASGNTIVNGKFGLRIGFGEVNAGTPYPTRSDLYVGYGRALTGAVWYKDLLRLEYRLFF